MQAPHSACILPIAREFARPPPPDRLSLPEGEWEGPQSWWEPGVPLSDPGLRGWERRAWGGSCEEGPRREGPALGRQPLPQDQAGSTAGIHRPREWGGSRHGDRGLAGTNRRGMGARCTAETPKPKPKKQNKNLLNQSDAFLYLSAYQYRCVAVNQSINQSIRKHCLFCTTRLPPRPSESP